MQGKKFINYILLVLMLLISCIPASVAHAADTVEITVTVKYSVNEDIREDVGVKQKYDVTFYDCMRGTTCAKTLSGLTASSVTYKVTVSQSTTSDSPLKIWFVDSHPSENDDFGFQKFVSSTNVSNFGKAEGSRKYVRQKDDGTPSYRTQSVIFYGDMSSSSSVGFEVERGATYPSASAGWNYGGGLSDTPNVPQTPGNVSLNGSDVTMTPSDQVERETTIWERIAIGVTEFQDVIKIVTNFLIAIGILTGVLALIIQAIQISTMASHPIQRRAAVLNLGSTVICIMMLGSIWLIMGLIFHTIL